MDLAGVTVYYHNSTDGVWFPLATVEKAEELILEMANSDDASQSTLDKYFC